MINIILQFFELDLVNINVYAEVYQNSPLSSRDKAIFTFSEFGARPDFITIFHSVQEIGPFSRLRIWNSAKPRPMKNVISQSLGLDLVNINVYAEVYQNIPLCSRDRAIFTFSEFEPRQRLEFGNASANSK